MVWTENRERQMHNLPASVPDYTDWKTSGVFEQLGAMREGGFNLRIGDRTERIQGLLVTPEIFGALRMKPWLGRLYGEQDSRPGRNPGVVLTYAFWNASFAGDAGVIGKSVVLDGEPRSIIGVLPKNAPKLGQEQIYAPLVFDAQQMAERGTRFLGIVGRLKQGVSLTAAQQRMAEVSARLSHQFIEDAGNGVHLQLAEEAYIEDIQALVLVLFGAVGFVLLIACANIANLLLARGTNRERELAIRTALGAGRWTLARQLLTESTVLGLAGGVLGILLAAWGIDFIASFKLQEMPNADMITINGGVLVFNLLLSAATGILFGLAPAWQTWRANFNEALKAGGRGSSGLRHHALRGAFVVCEIALTLILLVGAGLMLQSFVRMRTARPGFNPHGVLTMRVALSDRQYSTPEKQAAFFDETLRRVRALPGVLIAGATEELPTSDDVHGSGFRRTDRPEPKPGEVPLTLVNAATPDYFRAIQLPLIRGRYFTYADRKGAPLVVMMDAWTAKRYWPDEDPVGKSLRLGRKEPVRQIVGIVGEAEQSVFVKLLKGRVAQVYLPFAQEPKARMSLTVRTASEPLALASTVQQTLREMDVDQPVFEVRDLDTARTASAAPQRLATALLSGFAMVALLLAMIGIYGVMSYNAGRRLREIGIRMALGARRADVLKLLLRQGVMLTLGGVAIGLAGALALTRSMNSLLYGVRPTDALTFGTMCALLAGAAALACYIPARRATRVDPVEALRQE
jgi:putative ABC transport system permease protein